MDRRTDWVGWLGRAGIYSASESPTAILHIASFVQLLAWHYSNNRRRIEETHGHELVAFANHCFVYLWHDRHRDRGNRLLLAAHSQQQQKLIADWQRRPSLLLFLFTHNSR